MQSIVPQHCHLPGIKNSYEYCNHINTKQVHDISSSAVKGAWCIVRSFNVDWLINKAVTIMGVKWVLHCRLCGGCYSVLVIYDRLHPVRIGDRPFDATQWPLCLSMAFVDSNILAPLSIDRLCRQQHILMFWAMGR